MIYLKNEGDGRFAPLKLRGFWTEVHQIFAYTQYSQIIADEPVKIGIAIFHSV